MNWTVVELLTIYGNFPKGQFTLITEYYFFDNNENFLLKVLKLWQ